ncbi:MAG TPA: archaemetzincin family Zn-dependent metalloprotease [Acidobacteriota bacterium]|nr:archaemetzincin family Zn-dependent metalloprotease [Acidobacteriota bacterium]
MLEIQLVRVGQVDQQVLDFLAVVLPDSLGLNCKVVEQTIDPSVAYNPARNQYNSIEILLLLSRLKTKPRVKLLGLTRFDLFIPILTFVFGQAQVNNRNAVMSVHRLRQAYYGLPDDEKLFLERCEKEALHELGHTFGLVHCQDFECVMYLSNAIEQVDLKSNSFCDACRQQLKSSYY